MTWYTLFSRTQTGAQDTNGSTVRQAIPVLAYNQGAPTTGTKLRVTLRASTVNALNLIKSYIGHAATSGDEVDFDGTQVQLLYTAGAFASVPTNTTLVSDQVNYSFDKTKPLVVSAYVTFPGNWATEDDTKISYYLCAGGDVAANTDVTTTFHATKVLVPKVEVWFDDPPGNPTCTINKTTTQADPTSGTAIEFNILFNKGVTGLTAGDIDLSESTVGGTLVPTLTGSDLGYTLSVSGMLTAGNVSAKVPADVCLDAATNPNAASTSTDNVVAWDPDLINPVKPNVMEVTTVARDMLRIEVREPKVEIGAYEVLSTPDTGANTYAITNATNNGHGYVRITTTYGTAIGNYYIQTMTNNGSGLIRCTMFDTTLLGTTVNIVASEGCTEANGVWTINTINSTTFDLVGSAFVNTYSGKAVIYNADYLVNISHRLAVYSVGGTTEANGGWIGVRSGTNTLDLTGSNFVNAYTSGGRVAQTYVWTQRTNPNTLATDYCMLTSNVGLARRFQDVPVGVSGYLNRDASAVAANYGLTGGLTVTNVYRKVKPYSSGYVAEVDSDHIFTAYQEPALTSRHYIYLKLSSNLVSGTTYTLTFASGIGLPPKTFTFNDKVTRCCAIHVNQNGHRPADPGKLGYLSEWVPEHGTHGEMDFSAVTAWHLIDATNTVVATFGAPSLRTTPTTIEGTSVANPSGIAEPFAQTPFLNREGPCAKIVSATRASTCVITVDDSSLFTNDMMVAFANVRHWNAPGGGSLVGMTQLEYNSTGAQFDAHEGGTGNLVFYRIFNKGVSGANTFQLRCPITALTAAVASGGTGFAVGDRVWLNNRVTLVVSAVSGGVITGVTCPDQVFISSNRNSSPGSGEVYPPTAPSNPQAQTAVFDVNGNARPGTGATFNLTWGRHQFTNRTVPTGYDDTAVKGGFAWGNPDSTAHDVFAQSISNDRGNLVYPINELGNRSGTNVYSLDYGSFLTAGTYRVYIPNIGVSDTIDLADSRWWVAALNTLKAVYHERSGAVIDGRFGFTRPLSWKNRANQPIHKSYLPYAFSNYGSQLGGVAIPDVNNGDLIGGGHAPWVQPTTTTPQWGGHQDAGDWDVRIFETYPGYFQILDTWEALPLAAQASFYNMGTPTCLEAGLDATIFAGTDGLPSPVVEVIWGLENCRSSQEVSGAVSGGLNYGEGVAGFDTSWDAPVSIYAWYPDHQGTAAYAFVAAKLAKVLIDLGYTSLASTYQASALAAYDWVQLMLTDSAACDAYYAPVKLRAGWTTPQYNSYISTLNAFISAEDLVNAAAGLFHLTGGSAYKTICDAAYASFSTIDVRRAAGAWQYANATGATGAVRTTVRTAFTNGAIASIPGAGYVPNAEATDITYAVGQGLSLFAMNFGGANNWIIWSPTLCYAARVFDDLGTPTGDTQAARCRKVMQWVAGHRYGANQIGLCMANGLGVRNNLESLHSDSRNSGQALPIGITSEGWCNNFPVMPNMLGNSNISRIAHQQYDPGMVFTDPTITYKELFPYDQLAWPRFEYFIENQGAIEHAEYTTQQQLLPTLATTMYLAGFDGNAAIGAEEPSTTVLISSLNPSTSGNSVLFTATVSGAAGLATGTVTFKDGATVIGTDTLDGAGEGTFSTSSLTPGTHSITAVYAGDSTYQTSTSNTVSQVVNGLTTSTVLGSSLNPSNAGVSVTFTATVTGSGSPTGTVAFKDAGVTVNTGTVSAGVATYITSGLSVGTHSMTAVYSGDATFNPSTSNTVSQVVNSVAPPGPITLLPQACM